MIEQVREAALAALPASGLHDRLEAVLDAVADGVTVQDPTGRVVYANRAAVALIGFESPAELLAASTAEILSRFAIFDEAGDPLSLGALPGRRALLGEAAPSATVRFRVLATGAERWALVQATPLLDDEGAVVLAINTFHDITDRVRMEQEVRASELRYRQVVEAMPQNAWTTDPEGRLLFLNRRWSEYVGSPPTETAPTDPDEAIHPDDRPAMEERWRACLSDGTIFEAAGRLRRHDGTYRWHLVRTVPLREPDGTIGAWIGTSTDIDDAKRAEEGLRLLARATARLDARLDLEDTLAAATAVAVPELADWCIIDLVEPGGGTRRAAIAAEDPALERPIAGLWAYPTDPDRDGAGSVALRTGTAVLVPDAADDDIGRIARDEDHARLLRELAPCSLMALPLIAREGTLGVLVLASARSGRRYVQADLDLAAELAGRAALAISNAQLYEAEQGLRQAAEAALGRVDRLQRTASAIAGAYSREEVLQTILQHGIAGVGASGGGIALLADDGMVEVVASQGLPPDQVARWKRFPLDSELALARAIREAAPVWMTDLHAEEANDPEVRSALRSSSNAAACVVPILVGGRTAGAFGAVFRERRPFDLEDRRYITAYGDLCGQALDRVALSEARESLLAGLEEQRARLETVLRQMPAGVIIVEAPSGRIVLMNEAVPRIWSGAAPWTADPAEGDRQRGFHPDGSPYRPEEWPVARTLRTGELVQGEEIEFVRDDGSHGWMVVGSAPIRDRDGAIINAVATLVDVTDRRRDEENERFLADASELLGSSLDYEVTIGRVAQLAVPRIAEWCVVDLLDDAGELRPLALAHVDPERVELAERLRRDHPPAPEGPGGPHAVIRTGGPALVPEITAGMLAAAARDERHLELLHRLGLRSYLCVPLVAGGPPLGALTFVRGESSPPFSERDLALAESLAARASAAIERARLFGERVEAQERLERLAAAEHARAAELNAVIRAIGEGVVVCDPSGAIALSNPAADRLFPGVAGGTYGTILAALDDPAGAPHLGRRGGPVELRLRGDPERWVEISTYPVGREDGETIVLIREVTAARQRQAVRDTFLGVLSHELRTPITTIFAASKVLSRPTSSLDDATRREIFEDVRIEAERLHRLVEDVIALTRFGDEEGDVGNEPVLLQRILPGVIRSEEIRWPGVAFRLDVPAGLPTVVADPTYVEQVVRNLLSNAAKYGGADAAIEVVARAQDGEVLVRILDDGPGFPATEAERLFELFFRSPTTAGRAGGAGIGLFVCARLIRAMGGRIWAAPRPGGGAEFGFSLRIMEED